MTTTNCLSPLNFRGLLANLGIVPPPHGPGAKPQEPRSKAVRPPRREPTPCWKCPECFMVHDDEDEAAECCQPAPQEADAAPCNCPVCGTAHDSHEAAADCCLWKDFDAPTRWRMAAAVDAGSTWPEQLGIAQTAMNRIA